MFFIAYAFNGHEHVFAGRLKVVSHSSCRTSAFFKYFCPLNMKVYLSFAIVVGMNVHEGKGYMELCV